MRLSPDDETRLAKEGVAGDIESRNRVVLSLLHLVWWQAGRRHCWIPFDLVSAALVDILAGFGKWDSTRALPRSYFGSVSSHAMTREIKHEKAFHYGWAKVPMERFAVRDETRLEHTEDLQKLDRLLDAMPHPLVDVIRARMAERTLREIGVEMNCSYERIRLLEVKGMEWLKDKFANPRGLG